METSADREKAAVQHCLQPRPFRHGAEGAVLLGRVEAAVDEAVEAVTMLGAAGVADDDYIIRLATVVRRLARLAARWHRQVAG